MEEFPENKFQTMVDEMNRFEEEIGLPNAPDMEISNIPVNPAAAQPFVLGTNTFSQAQQKIRQINRGPDDLPAPGFDISSFIPHQVLHPPQVTPLPGGIPPPPPPPPPLSMPPAGLSFPPGIPMPYSQPVPPPPQPPGFGPPMMMRPETVVRPPVVTPAPSITFARRPTTPWTGRNSFRPQTTSKPETKPPDQPPKVVLSATPKLYTPKVEKVEDLEPSPTVAAHSRLQTVEMSDMNNGAKKFKPNETSKFTPVTIYNTNSEASLQADKKKDKKQKKFIRVSGGQTWEDPTLSEWDDGDFRLFCGDLGNDVTDELLTRIFSRYPSFSKAKVVRDKRTNKTKGFGFVSFKDPEDFIKASKEMNGRYVGSRPIKLRKSTWKNRNLDTVKKKEKEKAALIALLTGK